MALMTSYPSQLVGDHSVGNDSALLETIILSLESTPISVMVSSVSGERLTMERSTILIWEGGGGGWGDD